MGKRIEDLRKLDDTPIEHQVEALDDIPGSDLREQPWYQFVGLIDELLDDDKYGFAYSTLTGIKETVERTRRVSEAQQRAVDNIQAGGYRGRRYDGYSGRWR